jgi:hypothetical protein
VFAALQKLFNNAFCIDGCFEELRYNQVFSSREQRTLENDIGSEYLKRFVRENDHWTYRGPLCRALRYHCTPEYHLERFNNAVKRLQLQ